MSDLLVTALFAIIAAIVIELIKEGIKSRSFWDLLKTLLANWKRVLLYSVIIFVLCLLSDLTPIRLCETVRVWILGRPKQEQMVHEALQAYDRGDFERAIDRSSAVISEYEPAAKNDEQDLVSSGATQWPTGKVHFGKIWESMAVFERGSLNSVGLAWWVKGRSQQKLGHGCEAKGSFEAAATYSYARSWDPQFWPIRGWSPFGWFWSPPDDARYRAQSLTCP